MGKQSHPSHTVDGTISGPANILNITCSHSLSYSVWFIQSCLPSDAKCNTQVCDSMCWFHSQKSIHCLLKQTKKVDETGTATASGDLLVIDTAPTFMQEKSPCRVFWGRLETPEAFGTEKQSWDPFRPHQKNKCDSKMLPCQDSLHQPMPRFHCMRRVCQHHAIHHRQRSHHSQSSYRSQRSCHSHHNHNHHNQRSCRSQRSCHSCHNHHSQRSWRSTHHSLYASETRCGCSHVWAVIYQLLSRVVWPSHPMGSKLIKWYCWPSYPKNPWPQSQVKQLRPLTLGLMGCNVGIRLRVLSDQQNQGNGRYLFTFKFLGCILGQDASSGYHEKGMHSSMFAYTSSYHPF